MPPPGSSRGIWRLRIERAEKLSTDHPFASAPLRFYAAIVRFQQEQYARIEAESGSASVARPGGSLRNELDLTLLLPGFPALLRVVEREAPAPLAATARELGGRGGREWADLLTGWWSETAKNSADSPVTDPVISPHDAGVQFCARAFLEPYAQYLAEHSELPQFEITPSVCPHCGGKPQVGVLRPEGDGASRALVCSLCATEWRYGRILCPACGESSETHLAVYIAKELPQVRVEACETCRVYMKTVDLTKDGHAVAVVDEIAAIPLDLWARERGYTKLQTNLLGM